MRKNAKYLLITLLSFCFAVNVKAAECSYEKQVELGKIASTVTATYEETEIDTGETEYYVDEEGIIDTDKLVPIIQKGFYLKILNIEENIFVTVKNNETGTSKNYYSSDAENGILTLNPVIADKVYSYTIVVKGNNDDCSGYELRTLAIMTPRYNIYSEYQMCANSDYEYCQEYITTNEDLNIITIKSALEKYEKEKTEVNKKEIKSIKDKIKSFIKNNYKLIIGSIIVIIIVGGITILIVIKRRGKRLI